MRSLDWPWPLIVFAVVATTIIGRWLWVTLSTLRARAWIPVGSRLLSRVVRRIDYAFDEIPSADGAPADWVERRRRGLDSLVNRLSSQFPVSTAWGLSLRGQLSDLRFTDVSRVPYPFATAIRERLPVCSVVTASSGPRLRTLDGDWTIDVSGSYGVNVAGYDRSKTWIEQGWARVRELGAVVGPVHPIVKENVNILKEISGLQEVSFHMSGTEAVMAAVRLARFNTRRKLIVCFSGAYHGWWDGVQPGLGSERDITDCLTLKDMHPASLDVIRLRSAQIAAVLVNPVQSFHPNTPPPNDAVMLESGTRTANQDGHGYRDWLRLLRATCTAAGVPLILDEVYTGFRLAPGGAQEHFGVQADMVVYGKTVAGGLPIGVVCGNSALMRRFDPEKPMRMAYVVGTFSAHPAVMGAMYEFLTWVTGQDAGRLYRDANANCASWIAQTNQVLAERRLPVRLAALGTIWTVLFTEPSRFAWLFQYYLRAEAITLSWVGTGRCLCSFDMADQDYVELRQSILNAADAATRDGWFLSAAEWPERSARTRFKLIGDMMRSLFRVPAPVASFYAAVMRRKDDDHHTSHNDAANQLLHLLSSSAFLISYVVILRSTTIAMWIAIPALLFRQFGHAVFEPDVHASEKLLLGYTTRNKSLILAAFLAIPFIEHWRAGMWTAASWADTAPAIADQWLWLTIAVVVGRMLFLTATRGLSLALVWFVKLLTDPLTDLMEYRPWRTERTVADA